MSHYEKVQTTADWCYFCLNSVVTLLIITGNIITILLICKYRFLQTVTNLLAISLAGADLIIGLTYPIYNVFNYSPWGLNMTNRKYLCATSLFFIITSTSCSLLTIVAISVERYIAVFYPLSYKVKVTRRRVYIAIGFIWIYSPLLALISYFVTGSTNVHFNDQPCSMINTIPKWYFVGLLLPQMLTVNLIAKVIHARILYTAYKHELMILTQFNAIWGISCRRETKVAKMVAMISISFTLCWLPYTVSTVALYALGNDPCPTVWLNVLDVSKTLTLCNSFINPTIYVMKNADFRRAFKLTIFCTRSLSPRTSETTLNNSMAPIAVSQEGIGKEKY